MAMDMRPIDPAKLRPAQLLSNMYHRWADRAVIGVRDEESVMVWKGQKETRSEKARGKGRLEPGLDEPS